MIKHRPTHLTAVSYLAPNGFWVYEAIAHFLSRTLQVDIQLTQSQHDPLEDPALQQDEVDLAFICGLPFIRYHQQHRHRLQALMAPVMALPRYQNRPVYFADMIVQASSPIATVADLEGRTFCYNDRGSNSGYNLMRVHLMQAGYPPTFFRQTLQSGSHQQSMQCILSGQADCAAIDSIVLEQELRDHPYLSQQIRVIHSIGPCPTPPIVVNQHLDESLICEIQAALLHPDVILQQVMQQADIHRFAAVQSQDYEAIAHLYHTALSAGYAVVGES